MPTLPLLEQTLTTGYDDSPTSP